MTHDKRFTISLSEACSGYLGVAPKTASAWVQRGVIPASVVTRIGDGAKPRVRLITGKLVEWIEAGGSRSAE